MTSPTLNGTCLSHCYRPRHGGDAPAPGTYGPWSTASSFASAPAARGAMSMSATAPGGGSTICSPGCGPTEYGRTCTPGCSPTPRRKENSPGRSAWIPQPPVDISTPRVHGKTAPSATRGSRIIMGSAARGAGGRPRSMWPLTLTAGCCPLRSPQVKPVMVHRWCGYWRKSGCRPPRVVGRGNDPSGCWRTRRIPHGRTGRGCGRGGSRRRSPSRRTRSPTVGAGGRPVADPLPSMPWLTSGVMPWSGVSTGSSSIVGVPRVSTS